MRPTFAKAVLVLAAILAVSPRVHACTTSPALEAKLRAQPDADTYVEVGDWFGDRKQYPCALEAFQSALKLEPGNAKLYYLVGLTLYASGHPEDAIKPLGQSVYLMPEKLEWHILLAHALEDAHRPQEALTEWEAALHLNPRSPEALDGMSKFLMAHGDSVSAIELLNDAPRNETLTLDLALAYGMSRMLDKAEEVLSEAMKRNPSSLALTAALVKIYVNQVHYENAVNLAEKSVRLHPGNLEAPRLYLQVLVLNGDFTTAQPLARKLLAAHPHDSDFLYLSGILEYQGGQFPAARKHLEESVALDPNHYNAHYNLGLVLAELKDFPAAKEQLEKAIALGATEPQVHFKLSTVLRALGENDRAQDELKLYQQLNQAKINRTLAASKSAEAAKEQAAGNLQKAVALYREASDATPDDAALAYKLALALDAAGDTAAERTALERTVKIDTQFALAQNQLGYLDSKEGDPAGAEEHFRLAVKAAPGYTQAWISLAATLAMESRLSDAQEAVATALQLEPANTEALQLRKDLNAAQGQH
ncbi:MAG TPA: tetratricopeptide repeat protein [Candidatus Sulfotelmatobacter sp.]|nr:tetratricopeptide repeat protein [Candidatus Sulfotelmatobacter sp.]